MSQKFHQMISRTLIDLMIIICIPMSSADETGIRPSKMSQFVTVDLPQGRLRGKSVTSSSNGVTYCSFQGIPYAKPPVGPLRFRPPEDPEPWPGTRDATVEGAVAPQFSTSSETLVGEEDCLFLNVYCPQWPPTSPKAVMMWIHGAGFVSGSGKTDSYGPDFMVAEDVILVTINYRLGALGFLYLDGTDVTGNNGLRDQVMALKWVKNNISKFGGDVDNVTIFGESAGGTSVHYVMLSPIAAGLFHKAIAQSGTALLSGCHTPHDISTQRTIRLAKVLGCTSDDPQEVADFLRTVPAKQIVAHQMKVPSEGEQQVVAFPYFPSEELGSEAFLPDSPRKLLENGRFTKVPFMSGVTSAEGKLVLLDEMNYITVSNIDQDIDSVLPLEFAHNSSTELHRKKMAKVIKKFYFGERPLNDETINEYVDMMSDVMFVYPLHQTVKSQMQWSPYPTYVYLFDHSSAPDIKLLATARYDLPGAPHAAELPYLFQSSIRPNHFIPGSPDAELLAVFPKLWAQFAKTGNPSSESAKIIWKPAANESYNYLKINGAITMDANMYKHRMDFLEEFFNDF